MWHGPRSTGMAGGALMLALMAGGGAAQAQSLSCSEGSVREGDSKVWLIRNCGAPAVSDSYCARVLLPPVPIPNGNGALYQPATCIQTDEWLYDRGQGNLIAVVRMREGRIISIRFGEQGRNEPR